MKRNGHGLIIRLAVLVLAVLLVPVLAYNGIAAQNVGTFDPECYEHGDVNGDGVVDSRDAVQILYHSVFDDETEDYPVNQDCDFNGDGNVDGKDAIYILYGSFQLSQYPLEGQVHQFYSPEWDWTAENDAKVTFKCGCGQTHTLDKTSGVAVTSQKTAQESCLSNGEMTYTATVTFESQEFTDTHVVTILAIGHEMSGTQSCETESACANCDYVLEALGHDWKLDAENCVNATCQANAVEAYKCSVCGDTKTNTLEGFASHAYAYVEDRTVSTCVKEKLYRCDVCGDEVAGDSYTTHSYVASIVTEATCSVEGEKKYGCKFCDDFYTEEILTNDSHTWDAGVTEGNITTYTCVCGVTKTAVVAQGNTATVAKEILQDAEVQVNNAAIKLDEKTLEDLGEEVQIDVEVVSTDDMNLDEELKAQIGENPVYDFTLSSDQNQVSQFAGVITISLPYELREGDDVDCIDVWFINDDGEVECVMGTYSNGQVTFTTDHFSYYTVTRLTPKQRCENYGHVYNYSYKAPTCTANGHDIQTCKRCGHVEKDEVLPMVAHKYVETVQKATCTEDGYTSKQCPACKQKITGVLPALGHSWVLDEDRSKEATCKAAGCEVYVCSGCDKSYTNDLPQLEHVYETMVETAPDCVNQGYKKEYCSLCGEEWEKTTGVPTGHDFAAENAIWEWAEDYSSATVTLVCANDADHTKTLTAVVGRELGDGKTCSSKITYKAVASFNKVEFTDIEEIDLGTVQHVPGTQMIYDETTHHYECQVCHGKVDAAKHTWDEGKVITEATCVESGLKEFRCTVCGAKHQQEISATGEHNYVDHVCAGCGLVENTCKHFPLYRNITIDNEKWGICEDTIIRFATCDCGEYARFISMEGCELAYVGTETVVTSMGDYELNVNRCIHCGLVSKTGFCEGLDEETCTTYWYEIYALYKNGELIAVDRNVENGTGVPTANQHLKNHVRVFDVPVEGTCSNTLMETSCYCDEVKGVELKDSDCQWVEQPSNNKGITIEICSVCGLKRTISFEHVSDTCSWTSARIYEYALNGEVVYSFRDEWGGLNCDMEIADVEYIGGSCENGVVVHYECPICGSTETEVRYGSHPYIYEECIPVEGEGICWNEAIVSSCACGQDSYIDYATYCDFLWLDVNETDTYRLYACPECEMTYTVVRTYSEKDENCNCWETVTCTYADANGNVLLEVEASSYGEFHNLRSTSQLVEGAASCLDGVKVLIKCEDCGLKVRESVNYDHSADHVATYDYTDYGMCGDIMWLMACPCGEYSYVAEVEACCDWQEKYSEETGMYYFECANCNTIQTYENYRVIKDGCKEVWNNDIVYTRDGVEILRISRTDTEYNHRYYHTFELHGESCTDGYEAFRHCKDCDFSYSLGEYEYENHRTWVVERKIISTGVLCSDLEEVTTDCPCGKEKYSYLEFVGDSCEYGDEFYVPSMDAWAQKCVKCGVEKIEKHASEPGSTACETLTTTTYTYRKNGVNMFTHMIRNVESCHEYICTFEMYGGRCDDGYDVKGVCQKCGETEVWTDFSWCESWPIKVETLELSEYGCGDVTLRAYACPCGDLNYIYTESFCSWDYVGCTEEDGDIHCCSNCGLYSYENRIREDQTDSCKTVYTDTRRYEKDGVVVAEFTNTHTVPNHFYMVDLELHGETCQDGYTVTEKCAYCGQTAGSWYGNSDHYTYATEIVADLTQYGLCHGYILKSSCACGEYMDWDWLELCTVWDCETCGVSLDYNMSGTYDSENCRDIYTRNFKFTKDGEEVYTFTGVGYTPRHETIATFTLYNEEMGCEGGYEATIRCTNCDYSQTETGWDHIAYNAEYIYYKDLNENFCNGAIVIGKCACGEYQDTMNSYSDCLCSSSEYEYFQDAQGFWHHQYTYPCDVCGLEKVEEWYDVVDTENCISYQVNAMIFQYNGEVLYENQVKSNVSENHEYSNVSYALMPDAQSCYDGVVKTYRCKCGDFYEEEIDYHETYPAEKIDLSKYGLCDGEIVIEICACGKNKNFDESACACEFAYVEYDSFVDDEGELREGDIYRCDSCGLEKFECSYSIYDMDNCMYYEYYKTIYRSGEEVIAVCKDTSYSYEQHLEIVTLQLFDEAAGCEGGYTATVTCGVCDYSDTYTSTGDNCYTHPVEYLFMDTLEGDFCEGYIKKVACACGQYQRFYTDKLACSFTQMDYEYYTDELGDHIVEVYVCDYCGLTHKDDRYSVYDPDNCWDNDYVIHSYGFGDEVFISGHDLSGGGPHHTYESATYKLVEGATNCYEGVEETATCTVCGETETTIHEYHKEFLVEAIDLQQYGAVCGTQFVRYGCACGEKSYGFMDGDDICETQLVYIEPFVEGAMEDDWQDTSEGSISISSDYWITTCAVCGFKIRGAQYYVQEGCEAVQYEIWQFGFDEETGTWEQEIQCPTGVKYAFHDYELERLTEEVDENTTASVYKYTCSNCQSYVLDKNFYMDGEHTAYELTAVNMLDNGDNQSRRIYHEYPVGTIYENSPILSLYEYAYADGSVFWYRNEYTNRADCTQLCVYTDSYGDYSETVREHHVNDYENETIESTCSQGGGEICRMKCLVCGMISDDNSTYTEPNDHSWQQQGDVYACEVCGLQSVYGASGNIVMEDLTESYGEGVNYVIGYWNKTGMPVTNYVSVVLKDVTEGDDELVLGIPVKELYAEVDGITAISFSKEETAAAAQEMVENVGYTGDYVIRFAFVPVEGEDTLDYAITFDSLWA